MVKASEYVIYKLNKIFDERQLTNSKVSEISGIPISTVRAMRSGQSKNVGVNTLQNLLCALGIPMNDFFAEMEGSACA